MDNAKLDEAVMKYLAETGCDSETMERYSELSQRSCPKTCAHREKIRLLQQYRKSLLDEMHACQSKLDCLDYLLYQFKQDECKEMNDEP